MATATTRYGCTPRPPLPLSRLPRLSLLLALLLLLSPGATGQTISASPSVTPSSSVGSSSSPSSTPSAVPYGAIREIAVLDCNGGAHLFIGTPMEVNLNLRGLRFVWNWLADEIRNYVACTAAAQGCAPLLDPVNGPEIVERHFVPSMHMALNWIASYNLKLNLPQVCQVHASQAYDGKPNFAQTFFDDSAMSTVWSRWFGLPRIPPYVATPSTCTYATYAAGLGCKLQFSEPISATAVQVGGQAVLNDVRVSQCRTMVYPTIIHTHTHGASPPPPCRSASTAAPPPPCRTCRCRAGGRGASISCSPAPATCSPRAPTATVGWRA